MVHVRKLPNDINEAEVIGLGLPFGKVTNLLMLKGKNQVGTCRFSQQLGGGGGDRGRHQFSDLAPPGSHHNDSFVTSSGGGQELFLLEFRGEIDLLCNM